MPWSQTSPMDQRTQFIADYLREVLSVTERCELYGVSRKTGYKFIERYLRQGPAGLEERSRRPHQSPNRTAQEIVAALLEARRRHPSWGGKKLLTLVHKAHPRRDLPGRSTVCDILSRNGMVAKKRNRRHIGHPGKPSSLILAPNDLWSADFKGQFKPKMAVLASFGYDEVRFLEPVRPGDTLSLTVEWVSRRESSSKPHAGIITLRLSLLNQRNAVVLSHLDTVLVRRAQGGP